MLLDDGFRDNKRGFRPQQDCKNESNYWKASDASRHLRHWRGPEAYPENQFSSLGNVCAAMSGPLASSSVYRGKITREALSPNRGKSKESAFAAMRTAENPCSRIKPATLLSAVVPSTLSR